MSVYQGGWCCNTRSLGCANSGDTRHHGSATWGQWGSWGTCSTSCETGTRSRRRRCDGNCSTGSCSPVGAHDTQSQSCSSGTPSAWSGWSDWSSCDCSDTSQIRTRTCQGSWGACTGASSESRDCQNVAKRAWTSWGAWDECTNSCGAGERLQQSRCKGDCEGSCPSNAIRNNTSICEVATPRMWASWGPWGACDGCGVGSRSRTRPCVGTCEGTCDAGVVEPRSEPCPGKEPAAWSSWSSYSACSAICGDGLQTRTRTCEGEFRLIGCKTCRYAH